MAFISPYLTGKELFQQTTSLDKIVEILRRRVQPAAMFLILSQLGSSNQENSDVFRSDFIKHMDALLGQVVIERSEDADTVACVRQHVHQLVHNRPIYFPQGLFAMWKYILVHCESPTPPSSQEVYEQYKMVFPLCMRFGDVLSEQSRGGPVDLFQAFVFGERPNFEQSLMRTLVLYCVIARQAERYKQDFFDFQTVFQDKYGVSLLDYITALFGLYAMWKQKTGDVGGKIREDWYQSISTAFEKTAIAHIVADVIQPLCFTFEEGKGAFTNNVSEPWDFKFFHDHPLYLFPGDSVIPVNLPVLEYALTEGLFWKIRACFSQDDLRFQNFFGKPLELYVFDTVSGACKQSSSTYVIYPEIKFGPKKSRHDSPDVIVRAGNKVIAIEVKAKRLRYEASVVKGDLASIQSDQRLMTIEPMQQLYGRMRQILNHECAEINLDGVTELHLVSATLGEFPHIPPLKMRLADHGASYMASTKQSTSTGCPSKTLKFCLDS
ncbi:hypothetical protein [Alicyclobacillus fastidiosus]|uniref:hypothetical protein n=1 Tax=Alicyclobacillus fastidiosus TaxID=392011 RepID=UPI0024E05369|nr:hypothetical protein [Alicyclobacillus fastidiosus]